MYCEARPRCRVRLLAHTSHRGLSTNFSFLSGSPERPSSSSSTTSSPMRGGEQAAASPPRLSPPPTPPQAYDLGAELTSSSKRSPCSLPPSPRSFEGHFAYVLLERRTLQMFESQEHEEMCLPVGKIKLPTPSSLYIHVDDTALTVLSFGRFCFRYASDRSM